MPEVNMKKNSYNDLYHAEFNSPITLGHRLFGSFDGFVEVVTHSSSELTAATSIFRN